VKPNERFNFFLLKEREKGSKGEGMTIDGTNKRDRKEIQ
jgi:hypothetical protein